MDAELKSAACPEYEAALEDYLSGALDSGDVRNVAEHLKACSGCSLALEQASASLPLLRAAEPAPAPGPAFARVVMARIHAEQERLSQEQPGFWQPFVSLAWKFAATAALALLMMLAYDVRANQQQTAMSAAAVRAAETHELFSSGMVETAPLPASRDDVLLMVAETNVNYDQH